MTAARRALVTGLGGFTGPYVAAELERAGYEVCGLDVAPGMRADLRDPRAVAEAVARAAPDAVVHLAGIAFAPHDDVDAVYGVNLLGARHLLQALDRCAHRPAAVILASSAYVYGNAGAGPLGEAEPPAPTGDYAVAKLAMEHMARLWMDRLPIMLARPFNYTGVGQSPSFLPPKIVASFRARARSIRLGNLEVWRDFSDVRDVARAYAALLSRGAPGEVYNICSGRACSVAGLLELMAGIAGYRIEVEHGAELARASEIHRLVGSPAALERRIGPRSPIPLADTLRWMYESAA
jgi:nucleoside-diphosphate-sugar epimerase